MNHWYVQEQLMRERHADLAREAARGSRGGRSHRARPGRAQVIGAAPVGWVAPRRLVALQATVRGLLARLTGAGGTLRPGAASREGGSDGRTA